MLLMRFLKSGLALVLMGSVFFNGCAEKVPSFNSKEYQTYLSSKKETKPSKTNDSEDLEQTEQARKMFEENFLKYLEIVRSEQNENKARERVGRDEKEPFSLTQYPKYLEGNYEDAIFMRKRREVNYRTIEVYRAIHKGEEKFYTVTRVPLSRMMEKMNIPLRIKRVEIDGGVKLEIPNLNRYIDGHIEGNVEPFGDRTLFLEWKIEY